MKNFFEPMKSFRQTFGGLLAFFAVLIMVNMWQGGDATLFIAIWTYLPLALLGFLGMGKGFLAGSLFGGLEVTVVGWVLVILFYTLLAYFGATLISRIRNGKTNL